MAITLNANILDIDYSTEVERTAAVIRDVLSKKLKRRGLVIAMSGGIDSSVSAALSVKALGKNKVFGLLLPEQDSSDKSSQRGKILAEHLGIELSIPPDMAITKPRLFNFLLRTSLITVAVLSTSVE